ncbi:serine hydrolase domain-containing protein [Sphingomonas sp. ERG5]|uniref:serine hydrolase domain-containing protein n=1 Tax=Sphingomonas sp. ERG5 TaxID=1381597 RepID=UPI00069013D9|nr:serine hydrolase domain-containing protein [Sphingomonas sp. ERG5]
MTPAKPTDRSPTISPAHGPVMRVLLFLSILIVTSGCASTREAGPLTLQQRMDRVMPALLREQKLGGMGIAVIRRGRVVWTGYYGEQSPGVPVSPRTAFNTASIAKTVTAETLIALAAARRIDLDEPIAGYVANADLAADPRYRVLTARLLLSHRSGLRNWPDDYDNGRLAFDWDPGTRYRYSGAGVELAARYAQAKTGKTLRALAAETLFAPMRIDEMAVAELPAWTAGHLALPVDKAGAFGAIDTLYPGLKTGSGVGAAYDLITTVPAYASFLTRLIAHGGRDSAGRRARETILTNLDGDAVYGCPRAVVARCPDTYGYALGWQVHRYGRHVVLQHTGNDEGQTDLVYVSPDTQDGAVIFVNGANGWVAITRAIELIGNEPLVAGYYRGLVEAVLHERMPTDDTK